MVIYRLGKKLGLGFKDFLQRERDGRGKIVARRSRRRGEQDSGASLHTGRIGRMINYWWCIVGSLGGMFLYG